MVGPPYQPPQPLPAAPPGAYKESPAQFKQADAGTWKVAQPQDAMLRGKWWEVFRNPELNALEEQLNIDNQNIKQAFEQYMAARAIIAQARSQLFPTVTIAPAFTRSRFPSGAGSSAGTSANASGSTATGSGTVSSFWNLPLDVSWEPDLWGKVRYAINQAAYNAQLSAADLENVRLAAQASLAQFFFQIRGQDTLQKLFNDTVVEDQRLLDYTRAQFDTGVGDQISVVQAENTLQTAQAAAAGIGIARAQFEHAIAILVGKSPSQFSIPVKPLVTTAPPVPIGVPSQLLERRPDVAAAERTMAAANAQIGIGQAAYYPALTLSAGAGFEGSTFKDLLNWSNRFWSVGPSLSYTLYDAGLRRATLNQFIATYNADVAGYRQAVLTAFQQVEDSLASLRLLSQELAKEQEAVKSAQEFVKLELGRYETGVDPYIDVVTARTTLLQNQQAEVNLHVQEMTSVVQLITALGGGWDRSQLPTTQQVSEWPGHVEVMQR
jgi:NodT family efflux transporter outer membrane factor (OMF) lipoprotein